MITPGFGAMWAVTRYDDSKVMLTDPRFELTSGTFMRPDVPAHCLRYMRTMQEMDGPEHLRLRRLVSPSFTARRAAEFRPRITRIVDTLLDELAEQTGGGPVDLLAGFARSLPIDVICELVGVPAEDRAAWRTYGVAVATGHGPAFTEAIPAIMRDAAATVARRTREPGTDLLSELIEVHAEDNDRLSEVELVTLVWHLVLAGQTPANLIANAVEALLRHPDQLDIHRPAEQPAQLGYAHGPHFCLGAALARVQTEVALSALLHRFPTLALADGGAQRVPDPGTWRLTALMVTLSP